MAGQTAYGHVTADGRFPRCPHNPLLVSSSGITMSGAASTPFSAAGQDSMAIARMPRLTSPDDGGDGHYRRKGCWRSTTSFLRRGSALAV